MTFKALEAAQSSYSLGPLVTEDDTEQIQYEVYEMGTYSFAIKTDSVLTEGQTLVLHNKLGHKKFHVEPILDFEGHFKLYSEEHTRISNLAVFKGERPSTQAPRFDMDIETRVFVKTFGSKLPFMMDLTNVSKTGFRMDTGNMTHKIPFRENTLVEVVVPLQPGISKDISVLGKVVWVADDSKSRLKDKFGVTLVDFEESEISNWHELVSRFEQNEYESKAEKLHLTA